MTEPSLQSDLLNLNRSFGKALRISYILDHIFCQRPGSSSLWSARLFLFLFMMIRTVSDSFEGMRTNFPFSWLEKQFSLSLQYSDWGRSSSSLSFWVLYDKMLGKCFIIAAFIRILLLQTNILDEQVFFRITYHCLCLPCLNEFYGLFTFNEQRLIFQFSLFSSTPLFFSFF